MTKAAASPVTAAAGLHVEVARHTGAVVSCCTGSTLGFPYNAVFNGDGILRALISGAVFSGVLP